MAISDYFQYEFTLAQNHLAPLLLERRILTGSARVLDVGCGYGGTLAALQETVPDMWGQGVELDASMVAEGSSRLKNRERIHLHPGNFFNWIDGAYDLILMRDVLEHIVDPEKALAHAVRLLNPGGSIFISFAPFLGPFGGHQHNGSGWFSALPWAQLLPEKIFRRFLAVRGNVYKSRVSLTEDMESVLATRLTLRRFRKAVRMSNLIPVYQANYFSRPDYRIKFGWPSVRFPSLPFMEELFSTGLETILQIGPETSVLQK